MIGSQTTLKELPFMANMFELLRTQGWLLALPKAAARRAAFVTRPHHSLHDLRGAPTLSLADEPPLWEEDETE
eukprot:m.277565 g.277565  ORF g.277565 m.277565 type:complete len:73 (-) comp54875_c0_seq1:135-353(-)